MKKKETIKFSVCISVYKKDNAEYFRQALESIIDQSTKPSEIILVVDGPVSDNINKIINKFENSLKNFKTIRLSQNKGHAIARQTGIKEASHEIVALMDSDDISLPDRFRKELKCFNEDSKLSVVGGYIQEFTKSVKNITGLRTVPVSDKEIKNYMKKRCPMNQVTVMFRKKDVLGVGGYLDWYCNEDYYLWIRMYEAGCKFKNLDEILVNVRVDQDSYRRRGGWKYFKSEAKQMGGNGKKAVLEKYNWENESKKLLKVYEKIK